MAETVVARIVSARAAGHGESVPYPRYGEDVETVLAAIRAYDAPLTRDAIQQAMPPGAARAAVDCALWDWRAKSGAETVADGLVELCGARPQGRTLRTAFTLSLADPDAMGRAAAQAADRPVLKLKLGDATQDLDRVRAIRDARPDATLIADANEGWDLQTLETLIDPLAALGVALIEQPLPTGADTALGDRKWPVLLCADESVHTRAQLDALPAAYGAINIKIDKAGGLTEAALLAATARERGLQIMVGCMVGTSLSMAPAALLADAVAAEFVDLDGPLLLEKDRQNGLIYRGASMAPPSPALWG